ncbi:reverse transcriptase/maturase family protein [Candidatus Parcubacteria bacterium]|nr:reverse transcriptase/maturase family protein [Candidatus Parcubacteria bacterium]
MKIYKNIFKDIISMENLLLGWDEFKKGKREKLDVQKFELNLENNLFTLHEELKNKKYKHNKYIGFYINDPKKRHIHKATVKDRIVHHSIHRKLYSIFNPAFISTLYSSRKGKGIHRAVIKLNEMLRTVNQNYNKCFVLKCDIKKFFPTIDHKILMKIIAERIKDKNALWLIKEIVKSFESDFTTKMDKKGVPIGNLTSQILVNIYMNELDQFIKQKLKVKYYVRYADDFIIVHYDQNYLSDLKNKIDLFLTKELKLSLHPDKIFIRKYHQGVDYLGYVILPKAIILRTKTKKRIFRKIKQKIKEFKQGEIDEKTLMRSFNSYLGVLSHADSYKLEQELRHKIWEWLKNPEL